ncbi:MAG: hypothetical protein R2694_18725 [Ilumatobacteraceae bacterium]|nr:hypothetical protein [Acidimicrobiaceae bacterium]MCO5330324.1 hypothetical protein [Ilumatobacteraceae bacterium]
MGLLARGGEDSKQPANKRAAGGPPEGEPGETVTVMITDVFPPLVIMAEVMEDGWFADEVYAQIEAARAAKD